MEGLKKILEDMKKEELNLDNLEMKKIYKLCCKRGYEGSEERFSKDFINILMEGLKNLKISNEDLLKVAGGSNIMNSKKFTAAALSILGLTSSFSPTAGASFLTENKNISEISSKGMAWVKQNSTKVGVGTALTTGGAIGLAAILGVGAHALKKVDLEDQSAVYLSQKINEIGQKFEANKDNFKSMDEGNFKNFAGGILDLIKTFEEPVAAGDSTGDDAVTKAKTEKEAYNAFRSLGGKDLKSKLEKIVNASDDNSGDDDQSKKDEELKNNKVVVLRAWINLLGKALSISKKENSGGFISLSKEVAEATLPALTALNEVLPLDENSPESKLKDIMGDFILGCEKIQNFYKLIYEACSENEATIKNANGFGLYDLRKKLFACKNTGDITALENEIDTKMDEFKGSPQAKLFNELEIAQKGKEAAEQARDTAQEAKEQAEQEKQLVEEERNTAQQKLNTAQKESIARFSVVSLRLMYNIISGLKLNDGDLNKNTILDPMQEIFLNVNGIFKVLNPEFGTINNEINVQLVNNLIDNIGKFVTNIREIAGLGRDIPDEEEQINKQTTPTQVHAIKATNTYRSLDLMAKNPDKVFDALGLSVKIIPESLLAIYEQFNANNQLKAINALHNYLKGYIFEGKFRGFTPEINELGNAVFNLPTQQEEEEEE